MASLVANTLISDAPSGTTIVIIAVMIPIAVIGLAWRLWWCIRRIKKMAKDDDIEQSTDHQGRAVVDKGKDALNMSNPNQNTRLEVATDKSIIADPGGQAILQRDSGRIISQAATTTSRRQLEGQVQRMRTMGQSEMERIQAPYMAHLSKQRASRDVSPPPYVDIVPTPKVVSVKP